ncbi:glycoside hydrolase family 28 protein [Arachidicoccus soli]|uniref:Exopolygalacturonase n=1 Tax=Arachidicoccus soli TaxID=2341117 RepID=A0A386HMI4_9BACT|nr:glycosyl hydrolase family 28 protein [Arachidicoccus soli]AYD46826.1 exopolygalacturonase [Arachidicoccus soli]
MRKIIILLVIFISALSVNGQEYLITNYGASLDSNRLNTTVIQNVIDKASLNGGGTIVIPKGVFLTGALFFQPNTKLKLMEGAKLKGSDNIADYPFGPSRMEGHNLYYYAALINAYHVNNFSITGPGTIDGNGLSYWTEFWKRRKEAKKEGRILTNLEVHRPRLLFIWQCNDVVIKDVKLHNSGFWTTHLYECTNVLIDSCDIRSSFSPVPAPSTDGVDIDVCKNILIKNSYISVNDDGVCIKGGKGPNAQNIAGNGSVENVLIENCTYGRVNACLTFGSECLHGKNIEIRNCKVDNHNPILLFKMRPDTYQVYENVKVDNITGKCGVIVKMSPWTQFFDMKGSEAKPFGTVRNVSISNVNVQCESLGIMKGNPLDKVSNISFKNINARAQKPIFETPYKNISMENVIVNGKSFKLN